MAEGYLELCMVRGAGVNSEHSPGAGVPHGTHPILHPPGLGACVGKKHPRAESLV